MHFSQAREKLYEALQVVQRAVPTRSTLPILTGIHLELKDQRLKLTATDLEIGIECSLPVQEGEEGVTVLEARYLTDIVRKMPGNSVEMTVDTEGKGAVIKSGRSHFNLRAMPPQDYPPFPAMEEARSWSMTSSALRKLIRETSFAVALEDTRPFLTGILLEADGQEIRMVSTDTSRLAVSRLKGSCPSEVSVIVPSKALVELTRIMKDDDNEVRISLSGNQILFELDGIKLTSRLIEGQFPNYQQVIPNQYLTKLRVERSLFLEAVERVSLISREGTSVVRLFIKGEMMELLNQVIDVGEARDELVVKKEGEDMEIAFNSRYLTEVLKVIDSPAIEFWLTGGKSPAMIRPVDDDLYSYVVMPVLMR